MLRLATVLTLLAALAGAATVAADNRIVAPDDRSAADSSAVRDPLARRGFTWVPRPYEATRWFPVTEVTSNSGLGVSSGFITNSIGLMRNVDRSWAVGASIDGSTDGVGGTVTLRGRRWFANRQAVELALAWSPDPPDQGVAGAIVSVRYAPFSQVFVQAGAAPVREQHFLLGPAGNPVGLSTTTRTRTFYGLGFAGPAGVVVMAVEVALVAALIAAWSGAD